jgi:hypothetical protein
MRKQSRTEALLWPQATVAGHVETWGVHETPIQMLKSNEIEQHR